MRNINSWVLPIIDIKKETTCVLCNLNNTQLIIKGARNGIN